MVVHSRSLYEFAIKLSHEKVFFAVLGFLGCSRLIKLNAMLMKLKCNLDS